MTFGIDRGFAEVQILKKVKINYYINRLENSEKKLADNLMLKRSRPRNCKMTFIIGRGFAECQILKK